MTGPHDSVIGVKAPLAIQRMRTGMPVRFETAEGGVRIEGALVSCDGDGRATAIEPVRVLVAPWSPMTLSFATERGAARRAAAPAKPPAPRGGGGGGVWGMGREADEHGEQREQRQVARARTAAEARPSKVNT